MPSKKSETVETNKPVPRSQATYENLVEGRVNRFGQGSVKTNSVVHEGATALGSAIEKLTAAVEQYADKAEKELRTAPVALRVFPSLKEALEKAAKRDRRTLSAMAEIILTEWLTAKGFLGNGDSPGQQYLWSEEEIEAATKAGLPGLADRIRKLQIEP